MQMQDQEIEIEQEQILTFHEEGGVEREVIGAPIDEQRKLKDLDDVLANDVIGFLKRPVHYADFEWLATAPDAVELIKEISLPRDWLKTNMIKEKLQGFRYLKCDFKIRVQVNAQPFNAGYLLITFLPLHRQLRDTPSNVSTFSGITGYRRVMLDLNEDTSAELVVPFSGIISMFDLVDGYGYLGVVKLYVYSPLTGLDNVDGTVWITADNVEVSLPTGLPLAEIQATGPAHAGELPNTKKDRNLKTNPPQKGRVSAVADTVASVAGVLKDVPVIGSVASAVEWAGSAVSSVASFFGFSKPDDTNLPHKQTIVVGNNFANYDGDSKAKSLALFSQNETEIPQNVFGTEQDEMSFSHILAQPVYLERFKMRQVDKQGTVIWKWPVDPMSCRKTLYTDATKSPYIPGKYVCQNTYLSYLSNFFKYYRGTINYHIKIIKTCFHSGRIRVFVVPGANQKTDLTSVDFNKVHSVVYDVRDTTSFDISVPYKWTTPWKAVSAAFTSGDTGIASVTPNIPTAMIYIQVINALRNPSTAADSIDFIVETSAGEDFQFALPMVNGGSQLVVSEEALIADYPAPSASGPAHAGTMLDNAGGDQLVANKIAIGEVITGWRTVLKRYNRWLKQKEEAGVSILYPYDSLAAQGTVNSEFDLFSAAELLYRFRSGNIRVASKVDASVTPPVLTHEVVPHDTTFVQPDTTGAVLQSVYLEPLVELNVPFYQETVALPTHVGRPSASSAESLNTNYASVPMNGGTVVRSDAETQWWRSIGESFSFGYLIGPPKTLIEFGGKTCQIGWMSELTKLTKKETFPNFQPGNDTGWNNFKIIIAKATRALIPDGPQDETLGLAMAEVTTSTEYENYINSQDAQMRLQLLGQTYVNLVRPYMIRVCTNQ